MALPRYVVLEKTVGQTPLEALEAWEAAHPEYASLPATYAGRLDPMASGKLLILLGEECRHRERYTGLDKQYEIEVVLGLATDTGDALGLPKGAPEARPNEAELRRALVSLTGTHRLPYPAFSSKTVHGKPLFQYALEGALDSISVPQHEETVYRVRLLNQSALSSAQLRERIERTLRTVPQSDEPSKTLGADFRQDAIRKAWSELFAPLPKERTFTAITLRIDCAAGTYMRTFAERLGASLGTRGFALSIHRTKIGMYVPLGPFGFWRKVFK